jgi:hypothetical protein
MIMPGTKPIINGESGPTRFVVYDYHSAHSVVIDTDRWSDDIRQSDLEPKFTCQACGRRDADVRPRFEHRLWKRVDRNAPGGTRNPVKLFREGPRDETWREADEAIFPAR